MKHNTEQLKAIEEELLDDISTILTQITTMKNKKCDGWEEKTLRLQEAKEQLEGNLDDIRSKINPILEGCDEDGFLMLTNKMIDDTIEMYFRYHIWSHPDMVDALEDFEKNGPKTLDKYDDNVRKWIAVFSTKKYKEQGKEAFEDEWMDHKEWVCIDDPKNPFSFTSCVEQRGNVDPEKLRNQLDELCRWELKKLIEKHDLFRRSSQKTEKENILNKRKTTEQIA